MSDFSIELDFAKLSGMLEKAAAVIEQSARLGVEDALDEWRIEAVDITPIDTASLRRSISVSKVEGDGLNMSGSISANAVVKSKRSGRRFNYGYYIHEHDAGGKRLRTPGTVKRFLAVPKEKYEKKWMADIEREIQDGLEGAGW